MTAYGGAAALFVRRYRQQCANRNEKPAAAVLRLLEEGSADVAVRRLCLAGAAISKPQFICIVRALSGDGYFAEVDLEDVQIDDNCMIALASALQQNRTLRNLNLASNNINEAGCLALGQLLKMNPPIRTLNVSWNALGSLEQGVNHIAEALACNNNVETLNMSNCQIGHLSAQVLAHAIMANSALKVLDLRWNNLGIIGGKVILQALDFNSTVQHLKVEGNHIPETVIQAIEARTSANRQAAASRSAEQARADLMRRELASMNRRAQEQVTSLQRENEALTSEASHSERLTRALKDTLGDVSTKAETLETRLELSARELEMRDKEKQELNDALLRAREELVARRHQHDVEMSKARADMENLIRSHNKLENETQALKHSTQLKEQQHLADNQILKLDLQRARDELSSVKREAATDAEAAEGRLQTAKRIAADRLESERERSDVELRGMQDRLRHAQNQLEQMRLDANASKDQLRAALEAAAKTSMKDLQLEHDKRVAEWERRHAAFEAERAMQVAANTTQKERIRVLELRNEEMSAAVEHAKSEALGKIKEAELEKGRMSGQLEALREKLEHSQSRIEELIRSQNSAGEEASQLRTTIEMQKKSHAQELQKLNDELSTKNHKIRRLQKANDAQQEAAIAMRQAESRRVEGLEAALQACVAEANAV